MIIGNNYIYNKIINKSSGEELVEQNQETEPNDENISFVDNNDTNSEQVDIEETKETEESKNSLYDKFIQWSAEKLSNHMNENPDSFISNGFKYMIGFMGSTAGTDDFGDFCSKQNYIGGQVIGGIKTRNGFISAEELNEINQSWDTLKEKDEFQVLENNLSEEENQKAMDIAIQMLEEQVKFNREELPDYGDCKDYYNNGNLTDWILTHPVGIGLDKIAEKTDWEGYQNFKENYLSKDGMFTLQNIPGYIWGKEGEDDWTDIFSIKSVDSINADIEKQEALLEKLKNNKDNPEEFAKLYHEITNGINFDAEKIINYSKGEKDKNGNTVTKTEIVGRNFIYEDIGKNRLGTDILFEINKTVGTKLCEMIPAVGPLVAFGVNYGVTKLDNDTSGENEEKKSNLQIAGQELIRTIGVLGCGKIKEGISNKTNINNGWTKNGMFASGKAFVSDTLGDIANLADTAGDIINGNEVNVSSTVWSAVNLFVAPGLKSTGKAALRSLFNFKFK